MLCPAIGVNFENQPFVDRPVSGAMQVVGGDSKAINGSSLAANRRP